MNSFSPALHSGAGSPISCPQRPPLKGSNQLYIALHSLCLFLFHNNKSPYQYVSPLQKNKKKQRQEQQQQEGEVKGRLPLFDIYKSLSEMHDAHPCECVHASVIRTRQACVCLCVVVWWSYQGQVH